MLNFQVNRRVLSSVSVALALSQVVTGCTGLALSNKKPVTLVQGPQLQIFLPLLIWLCLV